MSLSSMIMEELGQMYQLTEDEDSLASELLQTIYDKIVAAGLPDRVSVRLGSARIAVREYRVLSKAVIDMVGEICDEYPVTVSILGNTTIWIEEDEEN